MNNKKIIYFGLVLMLGVALILGLISVTLNKRDELKVIFLNVGQGDAILIKNGKNQVLIDGGRSGTILLEKLGKFMPFWDRTIETIIVTHPDADHYGGFDEVLDFYKVSNIVKTKAENNNEEWGNFKNKLGAKNVEEINSSYGTKIIFPNGAELKIIYPFLPLDVGEKDTNNSSIVAKLSFGENSFLLTGDLSLSGEGKILTLDEDITADVLKVSHHGSRSSTSDKFLDKVNPQDAIISVGKGNTYGHPHKEVLEKLKNKAIRIWRTDEAGNIQYECKNINKLCVVKSN